MLLDIANPLDFSKGIPPSLTICNTDSLGEQIQKAFPRAKVVKTLNSTGSDNMLDPRYGKDTVSMFVCGDDAGAKATGTVSIGGCGRPPDSRLGSRSAIESRRRSAMASRARLSTALTSLAVSSRVSGSGVNAGPSAVSFHAAAVFSGSPR